MTFTESVSTCMKKYADFHGRATRSEFWWFCLFTILVHLFIGAINAFLFSLFLLDHSTTTLGIFGLSEVLPVITSLFLFIPGLAVGARRLHDIGRTGWWQLLTITGIGGIVLFIFWIMDTKKEDNKYGTFELNI